jgi:glutathione synthase/RimK-type ligase-like ATP-grasp enzyme
VGDSDAARPGTSRTPRIAERISVDVEPVTRRQLAELAEYDGLFIRETTSIDNHTYRAATHRQPYVEVA